LFPDAFIFVHNPLKTALIGKCDADGIMESRDYLERNRYIVDLTDMLIATPNTEYMVLRSGTWSTIRYAIKTKKEVITIYPSGFIEKIEWDLYEKSN